MSLDATVGGAAANSYVSVAEATSLLADRLYATEFAAALPSPATQESALKMATVLLDQLYDWNGYRSTLQQSLRWPRSGVFDRDNFYIDIATIPKDIKLGCALLANELIKKNRLAEPATLGLGVDDVQLGPIHVKINTALAIPFVPDYLKTQLAFWGTLNIVGQGMMQVKLRRT